MTVLKADLQSALAYAVRKAAEDVSPEAQSAWLTQDCVWALYPAIVPDIKKYLQQHSESKQENETVPDQHNLLELLLHEGLIKTPRAVAVREYRQDPWFSQLNMALEIHPDLIWRPGVSRPELYHLTHAMGPYLRQAADLMGLPSSPVNHPQLCLGTLHSMPEEPVDRSLGHANPRITLAIYWQPEDLVPEAETRSISK